MDRDLLTHFPVIMTVARRGGFAAAATALNMSPSAVSHAVKLVEDRLGQPRCEEGGEENEASRHRE